MNMSKYELIIYWSDEEQSFIVEVPELPGCVADGPTYGEAVANAEKVIEEWIQTAQKLGRQIPTPRRRSRPIVIVRGSIPAQPNGVSRDAVYREMYHEMRRFRDYEFTSSMWYTAILLTIVGFVASTRFANAPGGFAKLLESYCLLKTTIVFIAVSIAAASSYLVHYTYRRYTDLRNWTSANMEPSWRKFQPHKIGFTPRHIYYITQWVLVFLILVLLFTPKT
jgi:predicted RNase H-like HicB family nuclease